MCVLKEETNNMNKNIVQKKWCKYCSWNVNTKSVGATPSYTSSKNYIFFNLVIKKMNE